MRPDLLLPLPNFVNRTRQVKPSCAYLTGGVTAAARFHQFQRLTALITTHAVYLLTFALIYLYLCTSVPVYLGACQHSTLWPEGYWSCTSSLHRLTAPITTLAFQNPKSLQDVCRSCWSPGKAQQVAPPKGHGEWAFHLQLSRSGCMQWVSRVSQLSHKNVRTILSFDSWGVWKEGLAKWLGRRGILLTLRVNWSPKKKK